VIETDIITDNQSIFGGGIIIFASSSATIMNNTITENKAEKDGGGFLIRSSAPTIADNTVTDNMSGAMTSWKTAPIMGSLQDIECD